jgi:ribosomal protein L11 methyltransferase
VEQWLEVRVQVLPAAAEAAAEILRTQGAPNGVVVDEEPEAVTITAYYPKDERLEGRLAGIEQELAAVETRIGACRVGELHLREVSEDSWINNWKPYFQVTPVGQHFVIKPAWKDYTGKPGEIVLDIDPGAAFGSGTHHTTALCLTALEQLIRPGMQVVDVGTGSGILAIGAIKLGAGSVQAVDIDSTAVRQAQANLQRNGIGNQVTVREGDLLTGTEGQFDLIVANILADIVISMLSEVPGKLKPGGRFLTSGIIVERQADVVAAAHKAGLRLLNVTSGGGWVALVFEAEHHA